MTHDNLPEQPRWGERSTVMDSIIRWRGGGSGACENPECGTYERRRCVLISLTMPSRPIYRLIQVAPQSRAAEAAMEGYLQDAMAEQIWAEEGKPMTRRLCLRCARELVAMFDETGTAVPDSEWLRTRADGYTACFVANQAGSHLFYRFALPGRSFHPVEEAPRTVWGIARLFWARLDQLEG